MPQEAAVHAKRGVTRQQHEHSCRPGYTSRNTDTSTVRPRLTMPQSSKKAEEEVKK